MNQKELLQRMILFINESNHIESIYNSDCSLSEVEGYLSMPPEKRKLFGHVAAYFAVEEAAQNRELLTLEHLLEWQRLITEEQLKKGHAIPSEAVGKIRSPELPTNVRVGPHIAPNYSEVPSLMASLVSDLRGWLEEGVANDIADFVQILGDSFQRFEAIHPFVDGNGRVGRLLACYLAHWFDRPIIVFKESERPTYYAAHESKQAMCAFMANKVQEVVCMRGSLYHKTDDYGPSSRYQNEKGEELIVEWHALIDAFKEKPSLF